MNAFDEREHLVAQETLPWLANGSLDGPEAARLQAHLRGCARCRGDLALLRAVHDAGPGTAPACDPDRAFARLLPRLDTPAANDPSWLRVAVTLQACLIAVLVLLLVRPGHHDNGGATYRALGAGAPAAGGIVVMFRPETPERELRRIVRASGGRLSGGPTAADAWLVEANGRGDSDGAAVLARLRAEPAVVLAEPLGAEGQP